MTVFFPERDSAPTSISRSFERIYRDLILNYDTFVGRNVVYQAPVMLVIYGKLY
jgi:hypothetical protein